MPGNGIESLRKGSGLMVVPGLGLFGRFGLPAQAGVGDDRVNPISTFYRFGVGYYYIGLGDKLPKIIKRFTEDEQGVELCYYIAVTPWLRLAPDLQVIDAGRQRAHTAVVGGLHMSVDF